MDEESAGVRELKTHLSKYLDRVEEGASVVVTRHGKPIGRIVPVVREQSTVERVKALREAGLVHWDGSKFDPGEPDARVKGDKSVSDMLLEDRR